jgi:hypothetical protein
MITFQDMIRPAEMAVCPAIPVNHERMCMKLILALFVATLTACGGGSSTPETTTVAGGTTTTPTPTPSPAPSPTPTPSPSPPPTTAPPIEPPAPTLTPGAIAWGKNQCSGCHGGDTNKGLSAALTMSSMQTVQKHKEAYGPTAISGWGITITQNDADLIAVYAQSCLGTPQPRECR